MNKPTSDVVSARDVIRDAAERILDYIDDLDTLPAPDGAGDAGDDFLESPAQAVSGWLDRQKLLGMLSPREVELVERLMGDL